MTRQPRHLEAPLGGDHQEEEEGHQEEDCQEEEDHQEEQPPQREELDNQLSQTKT